MNKFSLPFKYMYGIYLRHIDQNNDKYIINLLAQKRIKFKDMEAFDNL